MNYNIQNFSDFKYPLTISKVKQGPNTGTIWKSNLASKTCYKCMTQII